MMQDLLPAIGLLAVMVLSPGPNNLMVMNAGLRGGLRASVPIMAGVLLGTGLVLCITGSGLATGLAWPPLQWLMTLTGSIYLFGVGIQLLVKKEEPNQQNPVQSLPGTLWGVALFQLMNPKSWLGTVTVVAMVQPIQSRDYLTLAIMFNLLPLMSLTLWGVLGSSLAGVTVSRAWERVWDRLMGCLFLLFGLLILKMI